MQVFVTAMDAKVIQMAFSVSRYRSVAIKIVITNQHRTIWLGFELIKLILKAIIRPIDVFHIPYVYHFVCYKRTYVTATTSSTPTTHPPTPPPGAQKLPI